jgi:osmotically-inducible protein OsmY
MKNNRWFTFITIAGLAGSSVLLGQTPTTPAPDNTKTNKSANNGATADKQEQNKADIDITQKIRQLVTKDKALSTNAKNVKIVTQGGNVTLAGPVASEAEKKSIEDKAVQVAGTGHVKNDIQIAAKPADKKNP